ncbi:ParB family protein [Gilvimarinus polysaccharolyticus]|uniref:ParB family protein n=1 Tax=Gilvimarinus polysaccharolyticus TaxID=863921 RepID=UPI00067362C9|nr:ParB family protein [Gilvimarinus polysaccharolyticus]
MASSKNKPVNLSERLNRQSRTVDTVKTDPTIPTEVTVTLDELVPSEFNPRQSVNPKYDDIKDSIKARGIDHRFNVTRKSVDDPYQIADGGNTRLQALQELWKETGDEKFFRHQVTFKPWVDDEESLAGHLVENDLRGDMKLIERALAAKRWIALIEEKEGKTLSMRKVSERMKSKGWSIDHSNLSVLLYAVDGLVEYVPDLLWAGAGVPTVKKLRSHEKAFKAYWDSLIENGEQPSEEWETLWQTTLKEFDDISFDFDTFFQQLSIKFSDAVDEPYSAVSSEIFSIMNGGKPSGVKSPQPNHPIAQGDSPSALGAVVAGHSPAPSPSTGSSEQPTQSVNGHTPAESPARTVATETADDLSSASATPSVVVGGITSTQAEPEAAMPELTLDNLLEQSYIAIREVTDAYDIGHLLLPTFGEYEGAPGIGWYIPLEFYDGFDQILSELTPIQRLWTYSLLIPLIGIAHDCEMYGQTEVVATINALLPKRYDQLLDDHTLQQAYIHTSMIRTLPEFDGVDPAHVRCKHGLLAFDRIFAALRRRFNDDYTSLFLEPK